MRTPLISISAHTLADVATFKRTGIDITGNRMAENSGPYKNPPASQAEAGPPEPPYGSIGQVMYPTPEDVLTPYRWLREELGEKRMAFERDDGRIEVSAVRRGERRSPPTLCSGPCWELRCRQRAGEASGSVHLGYVPTREVALETLLGYMKRINETSEDGGGPVPRLTIEPFLGNAAVCGGDRYRTPTERLDVDTPSQ